MLTKVKQQLLFFIIVLSLTFTCCTSKEQTTTKDVEKTKVELKTTKEKVTSTQKTILCFGNSLTAGYGIDEHQAWPYLLQQKLNGLDLPYRVINAGLSGETSAGGLGRIDWVLSQQVDIFILELGANDMLRGLDVSETKKNLTAILERVRATNANVQIIIAGLLSPPNMGKQYESTFNSLFRELAKDDDASLIPFFLEGVAQIDSLNIGDGKHPNAAGQKIVLNNVWESLKELI